MDISGKRKQLSSFPPNDKIPGVLDLEAFKWIPEITQNYSEPSHTFEKRLPSPNMEIGKHLPPHFFINNFDFFYEPRVFTMWHVHWLRTLGPLQTCDWLERAGKVTSWHLGTSTIVLSLGIQGVIKEQISSPAGTAIMLSSAQPLNWPVDLLGPLTRTRSDPGRKLKDRAMTMWLEKSRVHTMLAVTQFTMTS